MLVELVYEKSCPNIKSARIQALKAFVGVGIKPHWREWEIDDPGAPEYVHGYGSPTVLIDGQDVSEDQIEGSDYCCRVYSHQEKCGKGVPAVEDIKKAMTATHRLGQSRVQPSSMPLNGAVFPAVGVAFLPKLACPACWPAYTSLMGILGIGFVDYTPHLLPLTIIFLFAVLVALAYRANTRNGYGPLRLGLIATGLILIGKFYFDSDVNIYVGLILLIAASVWNTWPKLKGSKKFCSPCKTQDLINKP